MVGLFHCDLYHRVSLSIALLITNKKVKVLKSSSGVILNVQNPHLRFNSH
uniref:Uncharacterized protein n=1 Tax=Octopus bimaculoides TaxID=37653 RepID=A0A0L8G9S8_OCTBM